jgi:hypothetical protein
MCTYIKVHFQMLSLNEYIPHWTTWSLKFPQRLKFYNSVSIEIPFLNAVLLKMYVNIANAERKAQEKFSFKKRSKLFNVIVIRPHWNLNKYILLKTSISLYSWF